MHSTAAWLLCTIDVGCAGRLIDSPAGTAQRLLRQQRASPAFSSIVVQHPRGQLAKGRAAAALQGQRPLCRSSNTRAPVSRHAWQHGMQAQKKKLAVCITI